jgi:hypothetical protein
MYNPEWDDEVQKKIEGRSPDDMLALYEEVAKELAKVRGPNHRWVLSPRLFAVVAQKGDLNAMQIYVTRISVFPLYTGLLLIPPCLCG